MKPRTTEKQAALLLYCGQFYAENDQLPTARAICDHFGWSSANAAYDVLIALSRRGYVERNALGKWKFTSLGRAFITERLTAARWHPTNGSDSPTNGMYASTVTV